MKKPLLFVSALLLVFTAAAAVYQFQFAENVRESLTYFPTDPSLSFSEASTSITLLKEKDDDEYMLKWEVDSDLPLEVYLRQDVSLLFEEARLKDIINQWEENAQDLMLEKKVAAEDSNHFQAISFHFGEVHYQNDIINSVQKMSADELYVIDSPLTPLESFRVPTTAEEKEWKRILDHAASQQLAYTKDQLVKYFNIPEEKYLVIPLTELAQYNEKPFPGLTAAETTEVIGNLWEGLYKNYLLGLKRKDGTIISPIGSTIPLIFISKDSTHLLVLIEDSKGGFHQLIQYVPNFNK